MNNKLLNFAISAVMLATAAWLLLAFALFLVPFFGILFALL